MTDVLTGTSPGDTTALPRLKADLYGAILSHATSLGHEKSCRILKHVL